MGNIRRASMFSTLVGRWQQRCGLSLSVLQLLVRPRRARSMYATCCYICLDTVCVVDSGEPKEPWESIPPLQSGQRQFCMGVSDPFKCQKRRNFLMYTLSITTAAADCNAADSRCYVEISPMNYPLPVVRLVPILLWATLLSLSVDQSVPSCQRLLGFYTFMHSQILMS